MWRRCERCSKLVDATVESCTACGLRHVDEEARFNAIHSPLGNRKAWGLRILVGLIGAALIFNVGRVLTHYSSTPAPPSLAPMVRPDDYVDAVGRFKARFPMPPKVTTKDVPSDDGLVVMHTVLATRDDGSNAYGVMWDDLAKPTEGPSAELDATMQRMMAGGKSTLVSSTPITLGRLQGRDITADIDGTSVLRARLFIDGRRRYQVITAVPKTERPNAESFWASFVVE